MQAPPAGRQRVKTSVAAERLNVSIWTLRRWIREGRLRGYRVCRSWFVDADEVERLLAAGEQPR